MGQQRSHTETTTTPNSRDRRRMRRAEQSVQPSDGVHARLLPPTDSPSSQPTYGTPGTATSESDQPFQVVGYEEYERKTKKFSFAKAGAGASAAIDSGLTSLAVMIFAILASEDKKEDHQTLFISAMALAAILWLTGSISGTFVRWFELVERAEGHEDHNHEDAPVLSDDEILSLTASTVASASEAYANEASNNRVGRFYNLLEHLSLYEDPDKQNIISGVIGSITNPVIKAKVKEALEKLITADLKDEDKVYDVLDTITLRDQNAKFPVAALLETAFIEGLDGALASRIIYPQINDDATFFKAMGVGFTLGTFNFFRFLFSDGAASWLLYAKKHQQVKPLPEQYGLQFIFNWLSKPFALALRETYPAIMGALAAIGFHDMALEVFDFPEDMPETAWPSLVFRFLSLFVMAGTSFFSARFDMELMMTCLSQSLAHMHGYETTSALSRSQYTALRWMGKLLNGDWLVEAIAKLSPKAALRTAAVLNAAGEAAMCDDAMEEYIADTDREAIKDKRKALVLVGLGVSTDTIVNVARGPSVGNCPPIFGLKSALRLLSMFMGAMITKAEYGTVQDSFMSSRQSTIFAALVEKKSDADESSHAIDVAATDEAGQEEQSRCCAIM